MVQKNYKDSEISARSCQGYFDWPDTGFSNYCPTMATSSTAEPDLLNQKRPVRPTPSDI